MSAFTDLLRHTFDGVLVRAHRAFLKVLVNWSNGPLTWESAYP